METTKANMKRDERANASQFHMSRDNQFQEIENVPQK